VLSEDDVSPPDVVVGAVANVTVVVAVVVVVV
jgi:hypothetical protein